MSETPTPINPGEERKAVRLRRYIDLVIEDKLSFTLLKAVVADISSTGMRILCDQYLPPRTKYIFTMKQDPNLSVKGEVRWVRPSAPNMHQCGVLFVALTEEERGRLEEFLVMEHERAVLAGTPAAATGQLRVPPASVPPPDEAQAAAL